MENLNKPYVDIGFIVPLQEELARLEQNFPRAKDHLYDSTQFCIEIKLGGPEFTAVAFLQDEMGKAAAGRAATSMLNHYDVGLIIVVGIAGGLNSDASIGDICFTGTIIDVLENAKIVDHKSSSTKTEFSPKFFSTSQRLEFALKYVQLGSDIKEKFEDWQLERYDAAQKLIPGQFLGRQGKNEKIDLPKIHCGDIICGPVSKSENFNRQLRSIGRKILAIETEGGGVFPAANAADVPVVAVRAICDYADKNKNMLEQTTGSSARSIAADNVMTFIKLQLLNPQFRLFLAERRASFFGQNTLFDATSAEDAKYSAAIGHVSTEIHKQLTTLSPEYRGKPAGYRLPLPRVKYSPANATASPTLHRAEQLSIFESIATHKIMLLSVPQNYPDYCLPWIMASELRHIEIDGRKVLPVVVDGDDIKPPQGTFARASGIDLDQFKASCLYAPVIIIVNFPVTRHRIEFLRQELQQHPYLRTVIVNRVESKISGESELAVSVGAERMDICDISFSEISDYLQRSFALADQEAGVMALRLHEMFKKFQLNAHPTYFVGIGAENLSSLLKANRRSELIQLAVSGFLSYVVASDRNELVLSRTTREEFLRRLVFHKRVLKDRFSQSEMVKFIENFAQERDYDLDPIAFIKAFQDKGILYFSEHDVEFSLPFIESYLLASELSSRPHDAKNYFDFNDQKFDFATFDLFSEISADITMVSSLLEALDRSIIESLSDKSQKHILLTNELKANLFSQRHQIIALERALKSASDDVLHNRPNKDRKQDILDIATKIEEVSRQVQHSAISSEAPQQPESPTHLETHFRIWAIATTFLGGGSERLDKDSKRALAEKIVKLTGPLLDALLRCRPQNEFDELREKLKDHDQLREILEIPEDQEIDAQKTNIALAMVDAYEFSLFGYPIRAMFQQLGDRVGQLVLRPSVSSVASSDTIESLIAQIWVTEIDAKRNKNNLIRAINKLPPHAFIRYTLSTYFTLRSFWNHWDRGNQLALLDAADAAIHPFTQQDRGRIKRLLGNNPDLIQ